MTTGDHPGLPHARWSENDHDLLIRLDTKMDALLREMKAQRDDSEKVHGELRTEDEALAGKLHDLELKVVRLMVYAGIGGTAGGALISGVVLFAVRSIFGNQG